MPVRERVSSFSNLLHAYPEASIMLESLHCMPALEGVSSFSRSTICLSGKAYHLSVSPQYTRLRARTDLWSFHYMPVRKCESSLSRYTVCLSGRAYYSSLSPVPGVSPQYTFPAAWTILQSVHYTSVLSQSTTCPSVSLYHR